MIPVLVSHQSSAINMDYPHTTYLEGAGPSGEYDWTVHVPTLTTCSLLWLEVIFALRCWNIAQHTCIVSSQYLVKLGTFEINCQPVKAKPELW